MSDHFHFLATDAGACLPKFLEYFDSLLARSLNAIWKHRGAVIEGGYNSWTVTDAERALVHAAYILANPCKNGSSAAACNGRVSPASRMRYGQAGRRSSARTSVFGARATEDGPGVASGRWRRVERGIADGSEQVARPRAELTLHPPPMGDDPRTPEEMRAEILRRLDERERKLIDQRRRQGQDVLGRKRCSSRSGGSSPGTMRNWSRATPTVSGLSREATHRGSRWRLPSSAALSARAGEQFIAGVATCLAARYLVDACAPRAALRTAAIDAAGERKDRRARRPACPRWFRPLPDTIRSRFRPTSTAKHEPNGCNRARTRIVRRSPRHPVARGRELTFGQDGFFARGRELTFGQDGFFVRASVRGLRARAAVPS